jgi:hypothetical protein
MRSISTTVLGLLTAGLVLAPTTLALNSVGPTDILLATEDDVVLQFIPLEDVVKIQVRLNNTASSQFNGSLTLRLLIVHEDGTRIYNQTIRRVVAIPAGSSVLVEQNWPPANRRLGNNTLTLSIDDSAEPPYAATFKVTQTGVEAGTYAEKLARYSWFLGVFVLAAILFGVVLAARRA